MAGGVHIIGGGLAGMATAVKLRALGFNGDINVYEAANHLGGRVASFFVPEFNKEIDNSHMMIKANDNLREYLRLINAEQFLFTFKPSLYGEKRKIKDVIKLAIKSVFNTECKVPLSLICSTLLKAVKGPAPLFFNVSQSEVFVRPFEDFARKNNIKIVKSAVCVMFNGVSLAFNKETENFSVKTEENKVVFALSPRQLAKILPDTDLKNIKFNKIANIHFLQGKDCNFNFVGSTNGYGDWYKIKDNLLSVTISDCKDEINTDNIFAEAKKILHLPEKSEKCLVVLDKFATIAQDGNNLRLRNQSLKQLKCLPALFAGDWTVCNLPCTMEAAVFSGFKAAEKIMMEK